MLRRLRRSDGTRRRRSQRARNRKSATKDPPGTVRRSRWGDGGTDDGAHPARPRDYGHLARSYHAEYSAAGKRGSSRIARAYEESRHQKQDPKTGHCRGDTDPLNKRKAACHFFGVDKRGGERDFSGCQLLLLSYLE